MSQSETTKYEHFYAFALFEYALYVQIAWKYLLGWQSITHDTFVSFISSLLSVSLFQNAD